MILKRAVFSTKLMFNLTAMALSSAPLMAATFLSGCGSAQEEVKHSNVKSGSMPEGGEWTGVYYSPLYGPLHLIKEGDSITGRWRTTAGDKWGEMNGKVLGDVFRFEWQEHTIGVVGPSSTSSGHGYFKYVIPKGDNVDHEVHGEWGLGSSDAGQKWDAIKQRNQKPDPDSVMPDETQTTATDTWDETGQKRKPEQAKPAAEEADEEKSDDWE